MKNKKKAFILIGIIIVVIVLLIIVFMKKEPKSELESYAANTAIQNTKGYKFDLRIYGFINGKSINKIVRVDNYKNSDKNISIIKLDGDNEQRLEYLVKNDKYYKLEEEKLTEVDKVMYDNTDIYLSGVDYMKNITEEEDETIGENVYKVYKGTLSKEKINDIVSYTDLNNKFNEDATVEVWLTKDNYVYKVYYRVEGITIYASYFGYGVTREINLDVY